MYIVPKRALCDAESPFDPLPTDWDLCLMDENEALVSQTALGCDNITYGDQSAKRPYEHDKPGPLTMYGLHFAPL
jgi:hypothetical protein